MEFQLSNPPSIAHPGTKAKGNVSEWMSFFLVLDPAMRVKCFWISKVDDEETLFWPMSGLLSERYISATSLVLSKAGMLAHEG